ncbi:phage minor head protein [Frateuria aurantia]|uniref:phage head morphogenesis protein n=1 Tax=Frateuria aurantia TaxID=81475 RepID=UPI001C25E9B2|nr:phage minor head protein [Frateuria aurantia]
MAAAIGRLIAGFDPGDIGALPDIQSRLEQYSYNLGDWAHRTGLRMIKDVNARDLKAWREHSRDMSHALRKELLNAPTGQAFHQRLTEQVHLIQSLPLDAARRVHHLTTEGLTSGRRAEDIAKEIARSGEVSASRAILIARTEVSRTASVLSQARAQHVGSTEYIWRTSQDGDVRPGHRAMNGTVCRWASPPGINEGTASKPRIMHHHPGCIWNCRCWADAIIAE